MATSCTIPIMASGLQTTISSPTAYLFRMVNYDYVSYDKTGCAYDGGVMYRSKTIKDNRIISIPTNRTILPVTPNVKSLTVCFYYDSCVRSSTHKITSNKFGGKVMASLTMDKTPTDQQYRSADANYILIDPLDSLLDTLRQRNPINKITVSFKYTDGTTSKEQTISSDTLISIDKQNSDNLEKIVFIY